MRERIFTPKGCKTRERKVVTFIIVIGGKKKKKKEHRKLKREANEII
jgi:hypothetical protein